MSLSSRRILPVLTAALIASAALVPVAATPAAARDGATFVNVVNRYRAAAGVGPVGLNGAVDQIAVERGNQLAASGTLVHDFEYLKARLAQLGICWQQLGEIIAYNSVAESGVVEKFVDQWYHSDPHRAIMLGSGYTHAGGSWANASDGRHFGVMVFVKICGASAPAPAPAPAPTIAGFTDISGSPFIADIQWLVGAGITNGCGPSVFCPGDPVARDQMASFIKRALGLPYTAADYFIDDAWNMHQDDINRIAAAAVTRGCGASVYCPLSVVSRAEMASFLVRALGLPPASTDYFSDDNGSIHEDAINRLAAAGVTNGCAPSLYCPTGAISREQMAAFLHRAFD